MKKKFDITCEEDIMPIRLSGAVKNMWVKLKALADKCPKNELIFLAAIASIFLPFIVTGLTVLCVSLYAITDRASLGKIHNVRGFKLLVAISVLVLLVPIFYTRWISVGASVVFAIMIIFFLYMQSIMTVRLYTLAFKVCCAMSVWSFLYAVVQKIANGAKYRSTAGMLNANYYATVIEFVVLICVYLIITENKHFKRYLAVIAINIAGLFLCDCQSSWLPIIVGILILLFFNGYRRYAVTFLVLSMILISVFITVPGILPRLDRLPQTFQTRLNIWHTAARGIGMAPLFGNGSLGYMYIHEKFGGYRTYHAHSLYLDPLLSYGLVGTSMIISYLFSRIVYLGKTVFCDKNRQIKSIMVATTSAILVHGFTDYSIFWIQTGMLMCLIMAAIGIDAMGKDKH